MTILVLFFIFSLIVFQFFMSIRINNKIALIQKTLDMRGWLESIEEGGIDFKGLKND